MSGQNWWRRLGLVVCIVASVGVVSGCEFNMDNLKTNSQVKATQSDSEKEIWRVFRFYLAATNEFNFTSVKIQSSTYGNGAASTTKYTVS